jgi:5-methyltetrahydrofolate--homocysteine methyltransferase
VVLGTVKGDLHDIGKNLVGSMLEGAGFEVFDLGIDVPPERFIEAIRSKHPHILALSALLTMTMPEMKKVIDALGHAGVRDRVKVIIGGAPVTRNYADEIGADGYGENASLAVSVARSLLGK